MSDENLHPLKYNLQFWLTQARYSGNTGTFVQIALSEVLKNVEDFFYLFNTLHKKTPFNEIKEGGYSLFKEGLKPSEESIPGVFRYNIRLKNSEDFDLETYKRTFLLIVSGKFDNICGIYSQKHTGKNWKIEIWSKGKIPEQQILSFFLNDPPKLMINMRYKK